MEERTFLQHYRVCTRYDGSLDEVSRGGPAINYKATDTRSGEPVLLQLVPVEGLHSTTLEQVEARAAVAQKLDHINIAKLFATGIEHGYFVLASEYLQGETADSWIVEHGPMTVDAVLHIALQVVRAVGAAAFYGLSHRALQPSNILIVPGQSPDGGWPLVKLLNFGLAGAALHSGGAETHAIAPAIAPQFASPEQLRNGEIDFRSEMYSLGATMCFLLTGAVPLGANAPAVSLSHLRRFPRPLRTLLSQMLRENPDGRPKDPVLFEKQIRNCLAQVERRQALRRKAGLPLAGVIRQRKPREPLSPLAQIWRGVIAVALLVLTAAAVGALLFPNQVRFWRRGEIGVPVGVPDSSQIALVQPANTVPPPPPGATQPPSAPAPAPSSVATDAAEKTQTPGIPSAAPTSIGPTVAQQDQTQTAAETNTATQPTAPATQQSSSTRIAAAGAAQSAALPAEGPQGQTRTSAAAGTEQQAPASSPPTNTSAKAKSSASSSTRKSTSKRSRIAQRRDYSEKGAAPFDDRSSVRARVVGTLADGRIILRLPSGRLVFVTPHDVGNGSAPLPRGAPFIQRPYMFSPPPPQYPPDYFPYN
ncbi:MAG TPA: protein kinase [Chthoniobacterales bacterium]|nr:protein kinase [Chthoniobacterales bacterium]